MAQWWSTCLTFEALGLIPSMAKKRHFEDISLCIYFIIMILFRYSFNFLKWGLPEVPRIASKSLSAGFSLPSIWDYRCASLHLPFYFAMLDIEPRALMHARQTLGLSYIPSPDSLGTLILY